MMMEELKYHYKYPRPSVTADCVVFRFREGKLQVLLIERGNEPYKGCWAFPGGFMEMEESAEECARRELEEETGLVVTTVRQFGAFTQPDRDSRGRVISIAYYTLIADGEAKADDDAAKAKWFALDEIPPLAFDHDEMLRLAMNTLKRDVLFCPLPVRLLPEGYTKEELKAVYEAILNKELETDEFDELMEKINYGKI